MSTRPASAVDHSRASGPPPVSSARWSLPSNQRGDITQLYFLHVALLRMRVGVLVPRVAPIHRIAERIGLDEHLLIGPVVVIRTAQQDSDAEVDVYQ